MLKVKLINEKTPLKIKMVAKFPNVVLANLQDKETTPTKETQVVVADGNYDGLSKVTVNPIPNEYIVPSGEIEFTQNGTYDVTDKASAKVNVPEKTLGTKTITANGTYKAINDNLDGYSEVNVDTGKYAPRIIKFTNYKGTELDYELANLDTSNITDMSSMFNNCSKLTSLDLSNFNTSNVTNFYQMCNRCSNLVDVNISNFDMSNAGIFQEMFYNCIKLKNILLPNFHTNNDVNAQGLFSQCKALENIDISTLDNAYNIAYIFENNTNLKTLSIIHANKVEQVNGAFGGCTSLTDFGGLINLGQAYSTSQSANYSYYKLDLSKSTKLTEQSIINVLTNLYDIATKGVKPQQVILGSTNLAKLVSEEGQQALQTATERGWNIS